MKRIVAVIALSLFAITQTPVQGQTAEPQQGSDEAFQSNVLVFALPNHNSGFRMKLTARQAMLYIIEVYWQAETPAARELADEVINLAISSKGVPRNAVSKYSGKKTSIGVEQHFTGFWRSVSVDVQGTITVLSIFTDGLIRKFQAAGIDTLFLEIQGINKESGKASFDHHEILLAQLLNTGETPRDPLAPVPWLTPGI